MRCSACLLHRYRYRCPHPQLACSAPASAVRRLRAASEGHGERLLLYSGHDTVLAPLLAALGAFSTPGVCKWPPYASRIALELWRRDDSASEEMVRVLFNGRVVTADIDGCGPGRRAGSASPQEPRGEFCPLATLSQTLQSLTSEFVQACGNLNGSAAMR